METRRKFLKKMAAAGASALVVPQLLASCGKEEETYEGAAGAANLIVPKGDAMRITGTFLDEISHDIPHQNWGEREWDRDFRYMKAIGIDTVILIRSGYRKFITYPSPYLLGQGCYMPSVDLVDMYLRLAEKYGMKFYFGLYDSGKYWDTHDMSHEVEPTDTSSTRFGVSTARNTAVSADGISAARSAARLGVPSGPSTRWASSARRFRAGCPPSSRPGSTARRPFRTPRTP